jgi:hypothetical protein
MGQQTARPSEAMHGTRNVLRKASSNAMQRNIAARHCRMEVMKWVEAWKCGVGVRTSTLAVPAILTLLPPSHLPLTSLPLLTNPLSMFFPSVCFLTHIDCRPHDRYAYYIGSRIRELRFSFPRYSVYTVNLSVLHRGVNC